MFFENKGPFKLSYIKSKCAISGINFDGKVNDIKGLNKLHSCFLSRAAYPQFLAYEEIIKLNLPPILIISKPETIKRINVIIE